MRVGGQSNAPAALPPGKTQYQLYRRLGGPQGRSGRVRISPPLVFDPRTVQPVASHYTACVNPSLLGRVYICLLWALWAEEVEASAMGRSLVRRNPPVCVCVSQNVFSCGSHLLQLPWVGSRGQTKKRFTYHPLAVIKPDIITTCRTVEIGIFVVARLPHLDRGHLTL